IAATLPSLKPTIMCGAPRLYEKLYSAVNTSMKSAGGAKYKIFQWAFRVGREAYQRRLAGKSAGGVRLALADRLGVSKVRERLGGRFRILISGAAPLNKDIAEFFHVAGINIYEGYGLTETSAGAFLNTPDNVKFGTVGHPIADMEVRIAEDGEIELRGV